MSRGTKTSQCLRLKFEHPEPLRYSPMDSCFLWHRQSGAFRRHAKMRTHETNLYSISKARRPDLCHTSGSVRPSVDARRAIAISQWEEGNSINCAWSPARKACRFKFSLFLHTYAPSPTPVVSRSCVLCLVTPESS